MFTVYVLYSKNSDKIYIGYTSDLTNRLLSHNKLASKGWAIKYRPWELIYQEEFSDKSSVMRREKELKSHRGRDFIRKLLK